MPIQSANPYDLATVDQWAGLNQQVTRGTIDDQELWWNENLYAVGPGALRSCWGPSKPIYTCPDGTTILRMFFGYIGGPEAQTPQWTMPPPGRLGWMFLSNGHVDQVDLDTGAVVHVGPSAPTATATGTSTGTTDLTVTGTTGVIQVGSTVTGTGVPAGTTIVSQTSGTAGGDGVYVTSAPTTLSTVSLTFTMTPTDPLAVWEPVSPWNWASLKVWRPGWVGSGAGQQGGAVIGSPQGLYAWDGTTLSSPGDPSPEWLSNEVPGVDPISPMPVGLPGIYCMEVYQDRLWVAGKNVVSFSAPSNGANFSTAKGGGSFGYYGDRLVVAYMDMAASAGYLYMFGDSSTDLISNVQFSGQGTPTSPITTNFTYSNVDPQTGHGFPRPVGRWGRYFTIANGDPQNSGETQDEAFRGGIYLMFGGDAQNIGEKVTNIWTTLDTSDFFP